MKTPHRILSPSALLLALALPAHAQDSERPSGGKIDNVEKEADAAERGHRSGGGFFIIEMAGDFLSFMFKTPTTPGRGYQNHPWGGPDHEPFVRRDVVEGRRFHTLSVSGFADAGSTTRAAVFAFQTTNTIGQLDVEYARFKERTATDTDYLHSFRMGVSVLPRVGEGMLRVGGGFRGLALDDGRAAGGPELEIGGQFFPARPLGVSITLRGAIMAWDAGSSFGMVESITTGSVFLGAAEVMAGWRWTKIEAVPAFGGPTVGLRLWF